MIQHVQASEETITGRKVAAIQLLLMDITRLESAIKIKTSEFNAAIKEGVEDYRAEGIGEIPRLAPAVKQRLTIVREGILAVQKLGSAKSQEIGALKAELVETKEAMNEVVFAADNPQQDMFKRPRAGLGFVIASGTGAVINRVLARIKASPDEVLSDDQAELDGVLAEIGVAGLRLVDPDADAGELVEPDAPVEEPAPEVAAESETPF